MVPQGQNKAKHVYNSAILCTSKRVCLWEEVNCCEVPLLFVYIYIYNCKGFARVPPTPFQVIFCPSNIFRFVDWLELETSVATCSQESPKNTNVLSNRVCKQKRGWPPQARCCTLSERTIRCCTLSERTQRRESFAVAGLARREH